MNSDIVLYGISLSPLIIALVAMARYEGMPSKVAPLLSLILGICGGVAAQYHVYQLHGTPDWLFGVVSGIGLGIFASGLYSHAQTFIATGTVPRAAKSDPLLDASASPVAPDDEPATVEPPVEAPAPA